jgi:glucokinase
MILAGDIGGTKTHLALCQVSGPTVRPVVLSTFPSQEHASFLELVRLFMQANPHPIEAAAFGAAGPVKAGRVQTTNLAWVVEAAELVIELGVERVALLNDLEALAYGTLALGPEDFWTLHPGAPDAAGNAAVIAAGTGLGEAGLFFDGVRHHPFATEGGHADFAPRDEVEVELWRTLLREHGRVSCERLVSGPGLFAIYRFLRARSETPEPEELGALLARGDPSAAVAQAALEGSDPVCEHALDRFVSLYGAEAGNLALKVMARGGVFVGGGIAVKILPKLKEPAFLESFLGKGRMRPLLEQMPVRVVLQEKTALYGAAS